MQKEYPGAIKEVTARRGQFSLTFVGLFSATFLFLVLVGANPDPTITSADTQSANTAQSIQAASPKSIPQGQGEYPVRIVAQDIKLDVKVSNPTSTDTATLDKALLIGAVRYPTSADLGESGTVLIFGHSSYLPILNDQMYKTFDGIQNLKEGNIVSVYSATAEYRYTVVSVKLASATQDVVDLTQAGQHLTLVTCDSFGEKTDRFVVTADFVGTYPFTQ